MYSESSNAPVQKDGLTGHGNTTEMSDYSQYRTTEMVFLCLMLVTWGLAVIAWMICTVHARWYMFTIASTASVASFACFVMYRYSVKKTDRKFHPSFSSD